MRTNQSREKQGRAPKAQIKWTTAVKKDGTALREIEGLLQDKYAWSFFYI
jgi:hypothetical protein